MVQDPVAAPGPAIHLAHDRRVDLHCQHPSDFQEAQIESWWSSRLPCVSEVVLWCLDASCVYPRLASSRNTSRVLIINHLQKQTSQSGMSRKE